MDNLLFATVEPSFKSSKGPTATGCPASLNSRGQTPCTSAVHPAKVITLPPESLTTLDRNTQVRGISASSSANDAPGRQIDQIRSEIRIANTDDIALSLLEYVDGLGLLRLHGRTFVALASVGRRLPQFLRWGAGESRSIRDALVGARMRHSDGQVMGWWAQEPLSRTPIHVALGHYAPCRLSTFGRTSVARRFDSRHGSGVQVHWLPRFAVDSRCGRRDSKPGRARTAGFTEGHGNSHGSTIAEEQVGCHNVSAHFLSNTMRVNVPLLRVIRFRPDSTGVQRVIWESAPGFGHIRLLAEANGASGVLCLGAKCGDCYRETYACT